MWIGTGIFLLAVGAILKYAVTDSISGVELGTIGVILMIAGVALALISLLYAAMARNRTAAAAPVAPVATRERVVERDPLV
jgi:hypothetical protein